jgi:hypothetical protein
MFPASAKASWEDWALKWQSIESKEFKKVVRAANALERSKPSIARKRSDFVSWETYGTYLKRRALNWRDNWMPYYWNKMTRPGGSGAARWWPLAQYLGWPISQKTNWIYCVHHESRGVSNPSNGCGLMQVMPPCANENSPVHNISHGLRKYRISGWQPWSVM